jgi:iron uptake system component EfeO
MTHPTRPHVRRRLAAASAAAALLASCSSSGSASKRHSNGNATLTVNLHDNGCGGTDLHAKAGKLTFEVTNRAKKAGEFEIIADGPHLVSEAEGIAPGATVTVRADVAAGTYQLVCTAPAKDRGKLTVTGKGGGMDPRVAAALAPVAASYKTYASQEVQALLAGTQQFVDAIKAGDAQRAKDLYSTTRVHYERVEPIAELFPDLDAAVDARADDFEHKEADPKWTGWHRLEAGLWGYGATPPVAVATLVSTADKLLSDTQALVTEVDKLTIDPSVVANGAAGLIEEASKTKISGEEERYSHTDIATLVANVEGAQEVVRLLTPALQDTTDGPSILTQLTTDFTNVTEATDRLKDPSQPNGYALYDKLSTADHDALQAALSTLSEQLSNVPGALGITVR